MYILHTRDMVWTYVEETGRLGIGSLPIHTPLVEDANNQVAEETLEELLWS